MAKTQKGRTRPKASLRGTGGKTLKNKAKTRVRKLEKSAKSLRKQIARPPSKTRIKTIMGNPLTPGPISGAVSKGPKAYRIIDSRTGQQVGKDYVVKTAGNRASVAKRARGRADKLDLEYGAVRYRAQPIYDD